MVKKCSFPILLTSLFILIIVASSGFSQTSFFKEIGYYPNGWGSYIRKAPEYNSWNQGIRYIIYVDGLGISNYHKGLNFSGNGTLFTNYLPYSYETLYQIEFSELGYDFYSGRSDYYGDIHSGTLVKPSKEIAKVFDSTLFRGFKFLEDSFAIYLVEDSTGHYLSLYHLSDSVLYKNSVEQIVPYTSDSIWTITAAKKDRNNIYAILKSNYSSEHFIEIDVNTKVIRSREFDFPGDPKQWYIIGQKHLFANAPYENSIRFNVLDIDSLSLQSFFTIELDSGQVIKDIGKKDENEFFIISQFTQWDGEQEVNTYKLSEYEYNNQLNPTLLYQKDLLIRAENPKYDYYYYPELYFFVHCQDSDGYFFLAKSIYIEQIAFIGKTNSDFEIEKSNIQDHFYTDMRALSTEVIQSKSSIKIYPNPVQKGGVLRFSETISGVVYSIDGKQVATLQQQNFLQVQGLTSGVYVLETEDSERLKFVVE